LNVFVNTSLYLVKDWTVLLDNQRIRQLFLRDIQLWEIL